MRVGPRSKRRYGAAPLANVGAAPSGAPRIIYALLGAAYVDYAIPLNEDLRAGRASMRFMNM